MCVRNERHGDRLTTGHVCHVSMSCLDVLYMDTQNALCEALELFRQADQFLNCYQCHSHGLGPVRCLVCVAVWAQGAPIADRLSRP